MIDRTIVPTIRSMNMTDLETVLEIDRLSFPIPWSENTYRFELQENRSSRMHVSEISENGNRRIVGYIGYWFIVDEIHISTLAVHPNYRGQGIGDTLLKEALRDSKQLDAKIVTLEVRVSNEAAIHLYQKYNFKVVGNRPRYYRDNQEDALLMTRENEVENVAGKMGGLG